MDSDSESLCINREERECYSIRNLPQGGETHGRTEQPEGFGGTPDKGAAAQRAYCRRTPALPSKNSATVPGPTWEPVTGS